MEYPGPGKDGQILYWSTSASVRANQPFLVSYINRSPKCGSPGRFPFHDSIYIDQPAVKIEEISCELNVNGPCPASANAIRMQQSFGTASPDVPNGSPSSEMEACMPPSISSTELVTTNRLGCYPFCSEPVEDNYYATCTIKKKLDSLLKNILCCF